MNHLASPTGERPPIQDSKRRATSWVLALLPMIVLAAVWLPFGIAMGGLIEEWKYLGTANVYGPFFFTTLNSPFPTHALRPLTVLPQALAYAWGPDSFTSWHVLLVMSLWLKGASLGFLALRATSRAWPAVLAAILILLYPADTMQLSFRSIHINWALALMLLGSGLFVEASLSLTRRGTWVFGATASMLSLAALCMYEASAPLVALPFVVLFAREGWCACMQRLRRAWPVSLLWMATLIGYGVYVVTIAHEVVSYQQSVLGDKTLASAMVDASLKLFTVGMIRDVLGGWHDAIGMVVTEYARYTYLVTATSILAYVSWSLARRAARVDHEDRQPAGHILRILLGGFLLACLGYLPFLVSPPHLAITQRTYLFASPGAVLVWVALVLALVASRLRSVRILGFFVVAALIFFGLGAQLFQLHHYNTISSTQRQMLRTIVHGLGPRTAAHQVLVLDYSDQLGQTWMFLPESLRWALDYLYGRNYAAVEICRMPGATWENADSLGRKGYCVEDTTSWTFHAAPAITGAARGTTTSDAHTWQKADTAVVEIAPDGSLASPRATQRADLDTTVIDRRSAQLRAANPTAFGMFRDTQPGPVLMADFGKWWSLEKVIRGTGWREPEWSPGYFHHQSSVWKVANHATLAFELAPINRPYELRGKFGGFANQNVRTSMSFAINGVTVAAHWDEEGTFEATVPPGVLAHGRNVLSIDAPTDPNYYGLSAQLQNYQLTPR